ncbi:hypothetical protein Sjap_012795 [Stephania japonica]|uniref:Small acidic protein-like domain-containing protein n=1 Tax=Stephania japonica TaxID=461633 RepID=A0AAP0IWT7_9MAGN
MTGLVNKNPVAGGFMCADQKKKLLWGNKKSTAIEEGAKGNFKTEQKPENKEGNSRLRAEKQQELQEDLEKQYTPGLRRRDGRTVGLAFAPSLAPASSSSPARKPTTMPTLPSSSLTPSPAFLASARPSSPSPSPSRRSFSFLRIELGDFIAFLVASNILLEAVVGAAGIARSWTSYFATIISSDPNSLRIHVSFFGDGFNLLDPIVVVVLIVTSCIPMFRTINASMVNWITSAVSIMLMLFIIMAEFVKGSVGNLRSFSRMGWEGCLGRQWVLFWVYTGFDMVATLAEVAKDPPRDIPVELVG